MIVARKENFYFSSNVRSTYNENEGNPDANTFSMVGDLTANNDYLSLRGDDGKYQFKLIYTYASGLPDELIWKQSSWLTSSTILGYEPISIPTETVSTCNTYAGCKFIGLGYSTSGATFIDGTGGHHGDWWHSVGSIQQYGHLTSPGHNARYAKTEALYVWGM